MCKCADVQMCVPIAIGSVNVQMNYNKYILPFICISVYLLIGTSVFPVQSAIANPQSAISKIDSLQKVLLTAKDDTNKVNTLNALSGQLWRKGNYRFYIRARGKADCRKTPHHSLGEGQGMG